MGLILTDAGVMDLIVYWYDGLWSMIQFAFQMTLLVVACSAAAKSPFVERILSYISKIPKTPPAAYAFLIIISTLAGWINWAFGMILAPILSMYLSKNVRKCHFPLMVVVGYACMICVQPICPSASAIALLASPDHFMIEEIGVLPVTETAFNPVGLWMAAILVFVTLIVSVNFKVPEGEVVEYKGEINFNKPDKGAGKSKAGKTIADRMNDSRLTMLVIGFASLAYIVQFFYFNGFKLNFNLVIFIFLTLDFFLYQTPQKFTDAIRDNMALAAPVMIQFPFYGGIMGMMASSGLTLVVANALIVVATEKTIYWFSYLSASIVNLFVPSQGGQWIVQGPILVEAAKPFQAHMPTVVSAFMYGDEATNLIQPLYIIPALSLVNMKLKEAWGLMAFTWFLWFIASTIGLIVLPAIFL
jgi:short-chain fatty acids transporter